MSNLPSRNIKKVSEYERLKNLLNSMVDAVIAVDHNLKIILANGSALNILDTNKSIADMSIDGVMEIVNQNNQRVLMEELAAKTSQQMSSRDYKLRYRDGSTINIYLTISSVKLSYGKTGIDGYVISLRDITREISLDQERDEFISVVSHELRTPIAISEGNISNAQLMFKKSGIQNDFVVNALNQAHDQILFLSGLVNDLSTLSRAERGVLEVELNTINVSDLLSELGLLYQDEASNKGLTLQIIPNSNLELLKSSELYLREILQNFITNSIKYTTDGSVTVTAQQKSNSVEFCVIDTGIGIRHADQEKVFDKFYRAEDHLTRQQSGTGLGLYITTKLAKLIHAEILVESELGEGSTFRLIVPNQSSA